MKYAISRPKKPEQPDEAEDILENNLEAGWMNSMTTSLLMVVSCLVCSTNRGRDQQTTAEECGYSRNRH